MKIFLVALFALISISYSFAGEPDNEKKLFIGGMMIHTGYGENQISDYRISGMRFGVGGKLSFHLGKNFRLGSEGYSSTYSYSKFTGYYSIGWGGLLSEFQFSGKRIRPVASVTIGGGKVSNLIIEKQSGIAINTGMYNTYSVFVVNPSFSFEYKLRHNLYPIVKIDYMLMFNKDYQKEIPSGPGIYIGILFSK